MLIFMTTLRTIIVVRFCFKASFDEHFLFSEQGQLNIYIWSVFMEKTTNSHSKTKVLVEGAVMVALAAVLSWIRIFHLPWGGSVTQHSMLPIAVYSIRHGIGAGVMVSFAFSLIQLGQGMLDGLFGWGLTPVMLLACILLDYVGAFTVLGFAGVFRSRGLAGQLGGILQGELLEQVCAVGYAIIVAIGLNFILTNKFKTLNMLPAVLVPVAYHYIMILINYIKA